MKPQKLGFLQANNLNKNLQIRLRYQDQQKSVSIASWS